MTAPTQQLPSWLSDSTSIATDAAGQPTATFTTVINLPLTYYGPSIPLGTDGVWVYGGSSSPAASSPITSIPATPSPTSALPSTPATPSTSALPSTTSPTLPSTLTSPSSPITSTPVATSTPSSTPPSSTTSSVPVSGNLSSHSSHTGVIVGSVLGSVLGSLLLLFLFICFLRKRQRSQQHRGRGTEPPTSQVMWMWHDVHRNDYDQDADLDAQLRSPDEGSPVGSGDERDAFLRRSGDVPGGPRNGEPTARLIDAPRSSQDSSGRPIGIALTSGASVAIASSAFGRKSSRFSSASDGARHVISREQLAQAPVSPQSPDFPKSPEEAELGPDAPLLPPPAFNLNVSHGSRKSLLNSERSMTPGNDPESALLYTAQRVRVDKNAVPSSSSGTSWPDAIGIPSILRRSWLSPKPRSNTPTTLSTKSSLLTRGLTDNELEAGRSLNAQLRTEMGYRDGARPISGASGLSTGSARSGNTLFYDAQSREDVATPPPVPPLPQGTTSTGRSGPAATGPSPLSGEPIRAPDDSDLPPAYEPTASGSGQKDELGDILDAPAPRPASPFASVSSAKAWSPPPGLVLSNPATTPNTPGGIDIDLLEEAPPAAGASWRQLAQGAPSLHERRTTFGMPTSFVYPREPTISEQGSLHSIRSHLSPHSALSAAGSAPVSNSASDHSRGFTVNSLKSLAQSSSISSIDRRLVRPNPGEVSPALSALGRQHQQHPHPATMPAPALQSPTVTSTTTRSSVTTHTSVTDPITGEVSRVMHAAWTGGRERERESPVPAAELGAWGEGGWSSPTHLRILQNRVAGRDGASHA
ncbi:hypothetical protein V8E53_015846 [Lactarius tabidus]